MPGYDELLALMGQDPYSKMVRARYDREKVEDEEKMRRISQNRSSGPSGPSGTGFSWFNNPPPRRDYLAENRAEAESIATHGGLSWMDILEAHRLGNIEEEEPLDVPPTQHTGSGLAFSGITGEGGVRLPTSPYDVGQRFRGGAPVLKTEPAETSGITERQKGLKEMYADMLGNIGAMSKSQATAETNQNKRLQTALDEVKIWEGKLNKERLLETGISTTTLHNYNDAWKEVKRLRDSDFVSYAPPGPTIEDESPGPFTRFFKWGKNERQAYEWLQKNPDSPKAAAVKTKLGIK